MSDEIFQLKPNLHGVGVDLRALYRRLMKRGNTNGDVRTLAARFIQVFHEHGVLATGIPHYIPSLCYGDVADEKALLTALTPDTLERTANIFGIRLAWLLGTDDVVYETNYSYKSPIRLLSRIESIASEPYNMPLRAISTSRQLDKRLAKGQRLELVVVEPISTSEGSTICRYHPFADGWEWGHSECRIQLKAMVRSLRRPVPLYEVSEAEMELAYRGSLFFGRALRGSPLTEPSLEDYAMTSSESKKAKETDEIPQVRIYMREHALSRLKVMANRE